MAKTKVLTISGKTYGCEPEETVLDALLRHKVPVPHACKQNICKNCIMRSLNAPPPPASQKILKDTLKSKNYFLACACVPEQDMELAMPESLTMQVAAKVAQIEYLSQDIISVLLQCDSQANYAAGQSIVLMNQDHIGKNYYITSPSSQNDNGLLEIHVPLVKDGFFSDWVRTELKEGDSVYLSGAMGQNFYVPVNLDQPLLLIGADAGLSPLVGIMQDALENGHHAPIYLFHGAGTAQGFYLAEDLREVAQCQPNFHYCPCITDTPAHCQGAYQGEANTVALKMFPDLTGWRVFICGKSDMVKSAQKEVYLAGASTKDIYAIFLS